MPVQSGERLLSAAEVAELLGVDLPWIYRRTAQGHPDPLPALRLGGHLRFMASDVHEYVERHRKGDTREAS